MAFGGRIPQIGVQYSQERPTQARLSYSSTLPPADGKLHEPDRRGPVP
jgi:hypothetical protein